MEAVVAAAAVGSNVLVEVELSKAGVMRAKREGVVGIGIGKAEVWEAAAAESVALPAFAPPPAAAPPLAAAALAAVIGLSVAVGIT